MSRAQAVYGTVWNGTIPLVDDMTASGTGNTTSTAGTLSFLDHLTSAIKLLSEAYRTRALSSVHQPLYRSGARS